MIIEVESVHGDTIIHGKNFSESELRTVIKELLSSADEFNFVSIFCMRCGYELLPYDNSVEVDYIVDYIIDLDTHLLIKPKY